MGYISLRPTTHYLNFSKSYFEPSFLIQDNAYIMLSEFQAHIYGTDYNILAFPWMNQQRDFSICAHVAVWEILKYYGNEHTGYRDITIGELVEQIKEVGCLFEDRIIERVWRYGSKGLSYIGNVFKRKDE